MACRQTRVSVLIACAPLALLAACAQEPEARPPSRLLQAVVAPNLSERPIANAPQSPSDPPSSGVEDRVDSNGSRAETPAPVPAPSARGASGTPDPRARLEADLTAARAAFDARPGDEDAAIWLGRRLAYLGRFDEAIAAFTEGLGAHPGSYRLLRHRGHRYLTLRRFDEAIADLTAAAARAGEASLDRALAEHAHDAGAFPWDEIEPDGAPNRLGVPRSAVRFNILYHLALALYLRDDPGDLERAADAYARCAEFSRRNDDMTVATANWRYLTLRRLGRTADALGALAPVHAAMNCLEDADYRTLCLLHKGEITPAQALAHAGASGSTASETLAYGVGMFHLLSGGAAGRDEARRTFRAIVDNPASARASFAYIAAERELARLRVE